MSGRGDNGSEAPAGKDGPALRPRSPLPRRFYKSVTIAGTIPLLHPAGSASSIRRGAGAGVSPVTFRILLDGKPARTPAKAELAVPTQALAEAIAAEWEAQPTHIDAAAMPLTRLVNTAIDGVAPRLAQVRADIAAFAASDLVCYRADAPDVLVARQCTQWDPVLAWARDALGARFAVATGLMPVTQPEDAIAVVAAALADLDPFRLTALHIMTTLTGSALLTLAHAHGTLTAEAAWAAAHVDEDFQISQWGEDAEAKTRRARRWTEMAAASRLLALLACHPGTPR
jgi:chaperone required for assembly of F1-ATPase